MKKRTEMMSLAAAAVLRNTSRRGLVVAGLLLAAGGARALTVVEDFEFYPNGGSLTNNAGGSGFSRAWGDPGNIAIVSNVVDLTYAATGYEVSGLSKGHVGSTGKSSVLSRRAFAAPFPGTASGRMIWFSTLIRFSSSPPGRVGWHFNASTAARTGAIAGFLYANSFRRLANGSLVDAAGQPTLSADTTHLIVGSVALKDSGDSTVKYWLDPTDCTSPATLGTAQVSFDAAFNGSVTNMGVEMYDGGYMDALRISDGNGDSEKAFLAVTRATPKALFGPVQFGSLAELTNNFALIRGAATSSWISDNDNNYGAGGFLSTRTINTNISDGLHNTFVADSDGAVGGGNDVFGDCTIVYDMRAYASQARSVGAFFLGTSSATRNPKHWMLNTSIGPNTNSVTARYSRNMEGGGGGVQIAVTNALNVSEWRHVRLDVRRVNGFTQVEVRQRIWQSAYDFRGAPLTDTTITYDAANSHLTDGEIGFSIWKYPTADGDIDNLAVYRWGGAPDWYVPRGTLIRVQ